MEADKETLLAWLQDAHAMENQAIEILKRQSGRTDHPLVAGKVEEHLEQSREHASRLKECIERLGGDSSTAKKGAAKFLGNVAGFANAPASDELVKNAIAAYTFESLEIASYRALVAAAEDASEEEVRQVCEDILAEEEAMAEWLGEHLPLLARQHLQHGAAA